MMKDFLGRHIVGGSHIVYPGRRSSSLWVSLAQVLEITKLTTCPKCKGSGAAMAVHFMDGSAPCLECMGSGLVASNHSRLTVQPIDPRTRRKLGRVVTVSCVDKVTVVDLPNKSS